MNALTKPSTARQGGMTLIELAVVLLVLIGLAGLTLPYVGGFVAKTSTATGAASNADLFNALSMYQAQTGGYPNNLDLLTNGAAIDGVLDDYAVTQGVGSNMNWGLYSVNGQVTTPDGTTYTLGPVANVAASLLAAGINYVLPSPHTAGIDYVQNNGNYSLVIAGTTTTVSATFDPAFNTIGAIPTVAAGKVAGPAAFVTSFDTNGMFKDICNLNTRPNTCKDSNYGGTIGNLLGYSIPPGHAIIVLGVGSRNSAIGVSMASAPVVFAASPTAQPQLVYARYMAAFDVDTGVAGNILGGNTATPAKLVGVVYGPSSMMLESVGSGIQNFYQGLKQEKM